MSSTARPRFLWKATSLTPWALAVVRLSRLAYPPSAATCRGGTPQRVIWRSSMGRKRSASAGLPASTTTSRIKPLLPVTRLSLCPYCTSRTPLTMMSACGSNRLTSFSPGRHGRPAQGPPLALDEDALDQRQIVAELGTPALDRDPGEVGQPFSGLLHRRLGSTGGGD